MATVYSGVRLLWKGDSLHLDGKGLPLARVIPDTTYPGMWRVKIDARLTDMLNKARAKDAAISLALQALNKQVKAA